MTENMYRFVQKGSSFTPLKVRPLSCHSLRSRPHTASHALHRKKSSAGLEDRSENDSGMWYDLIYMDHSDGIIDILT